MWTQSVGAKLARDSGVSACLDVECVAVIAGSLAPTLDFIITDNPGVVSQASGLIVKGMIFISNLE